MTGGTITANSTSGTKTFNHLIFKGGTLTGTVTEQDTINGKLIVQGNTTSYINVGTINVSGKTIIESGSELQFTSTSGGKTFNDTVFISGTWNSKVSENYTIRRGIVNNGTFISGTGTYAFNVNSQTLSGSQPITFNGNVSIANGITVTNKTYVTVNGVLNSSNNSSTWVNDTNSTLRYNNTSTILMHSNGTLTATAPGNTVIYGGSGDQTIRATTYFNVSLENTGSKSLQNPTTISNNLNIASGVGFNLNNQTLNIGGNWNNANTADLFTENGTVVFNGSGLQTVKEVSPFNNITKTSTGTLQLQGNLTLYGTLSLQGGYIDGNGYTLIVTNGAEGSVVRTAGWFYNGTFTRTLNGTSQDYLYPIGPVG
ncbi:MAG: hypothetical protein ACP5PS_08320, partial [Bacteroidales bacterium]